ncbi:MAG: bifunctional 3,4-dihydroxy-2-butanone-4-phosphate synthase/GTP cyclohydrolase II [Patescibacteria group bacterium]
MFSRIEQAIEDLQKGQMVIVVDDEDRENEGDLVMAAEFANKENINFMMREARGLICVPLTPERAEELDLSVLEQQNSNSKQCNFTISVDYKQGTSTGISAADRAKTIVALSDQDAEATNFARPGHIFPLIAKKGGTLVRAGHTEAAVDLLKLAELKPVGVICEIVKEDGEMARLDDLKEFAKKHKLHIISIQDLIAYRRHNEKLVKREVETDLDTEFGTFKMIVYSNCIDQREHIALVYGEVENKKNILVRAHSECMTGDVFYSLHCDCRSQLNGAMKKIAEKGNGVIIYMRQEGRGIGLVNKLKAYKLQRKGYDTVEANELLGFKADLREYGIGAQMLKDLGLSSIELLTNNPKKIVGLEGYGLEVTKRVPLEHPAKERNRAYLKTKKDKLGHLLESV